MKCPRYFHHFYSLKCNPFYNSFPARVFVLLSYILMMSSKMTATLLASVLLFVPLVRAVASDKPFVFFQNRGSVYAVPANFSGSRAHLTNISAFNAESWHTIHITSCFLCSLGSGLDKAPRQKLVLSFEDGSQNCGLFHYNGLSFVGPVPNAAGTKLYFISGKRIVHWLPIECSE